MNWICPNCGKSFRNKNQTHSCAIVSVEEHLINKPDNITKLYKILMAEISNFGDIEINPVVSSIQLRIGATFASIKLKKDMIIVEFHLPYKWEEFPVFQTIKASNQRFYHIASIHEPEDISLTLIQKLLESYKLVKDQQQ
jgi:hypothetical protein